MIRDLNSRISNKTRTLKWKEKLREACLLRAEQCRHELLWKIRSIGKCTEQKGSTISAFDDIVSNELIKIKQGSQANLPRPVLSDREDMLWEYEPCDGISELAQEEYEQIMLEMKKILHEDIPDTKVRDAASIKDSEKASVFEDDSLAASLFDQLQLQRDQVDLDFVRKRLSEVLKEHHTSGCICQPVFCIDDRLEISALYMQCCACEAFELVL